MQYALLFAFVLLSISLYGQKMTIIGDPTDSTIIKRKQRLEAKGFQVEIQEKRDSTNLLLTMGDQAFRQTHKGKQLPPFSLKDMTGNLISSKDLAGKLVHINFWSVTCAPCIQEFPELNELKKKYQDRGWVFLAFAPEDAGKVKKIVARHLLDYNVIPNAGAYYKLLGIGGYPKNFFLDRTGKIVEVTDGTHFIRDVITQKNRPDNFRYYDQIMSAIK